MGLTDAVITRLSNTPLLIRPRVSVTRFAGQDPIQTGRDLAVDAVVVGTIRAADDRAFTLEDSISARIVSHISGQLTGER